MTAQAIAAAAPVETIRVVPAPPNGPPALPLATGPADASAIDPCCYVQDPLGVDLLAAKPGVGGPRGSSIAPLPEPKAWAGQVARALVEVMHGARPSVQVARWVTAEVYAAVSHRGDVAARRESARLISRTARPRRVIVSSVHVCRPRDGVAEAAVVLVDSGRVRALALRLVAKESYWLVEALQVG